MTVSVVGSNNETVVFQTRKVKGSDLETDATLLDLDDIPMPSGVLDSNNQTYANFTALYADLPTNQNIRGPQGPQGPAIDSVSLAQSVDLATVTMTFGYTLNNQGYTVGTTPSFTIPAGPTGPTGTGIQFVSHDTQNHTLTFQFTDTLSDLTVDLPQGDTGPAGRSISSISKSGDVMTINYDDGSSPTQISGIRGPAGDAATITVSATNTLAAGASATVTETGTSNSQNRELIFGIPAGADGVDGTGFTGGSYDAATGVVTFTSNDNLGFSTGDLRGADGVDGDDGVSVTDVNQVNATTINFSLSDSTTTSNITLPSATASSILPSYTNNAGKVLAVNSNANDIEWIAGSGTGTVTSVGLTGANGISFTGSPITTSGTISTTVDAATLKSHLAIDWTDVANKPSIPVSGTDFDPVGTDNSTNVTLNTASYDYLSLAGQTITLGQVDWTTDIANKPSIPVSGTDFDPVGTDNSTNVSLVTTSYDYLSLTGQAITLGAIDWTTDITNKPSIPVSGTDFDPVGTDNSTNVSLVTTSYDYLSLAGQTITLGAIDWTTDISNKPTIPVSGTDFDPVGTDNSTNVSLNTTNYDYLSITGQAITLGAIDWTTDITNKPTIPVSGTDFDPVGTDNSTNVTLNNTTYDYLTISGQAITVGQVDWTTDISNRPSIPVSGTDFDPVGTDNSTNVSLATVSNNYLSLSGQEITAGTIPYQLGGTGLTALGSAGQVLTVNTAGNALEYQTPSGGGGGSGSSYIEHSSTVSDSLAISSGTNRMYIGNTTFSGSGTMAGYLLISHGYANFTSASALNVTGTLKVVS
jgi:hypothetical protein